jgi:hypothetical protein
MWNVRVEWVQSSFACGRLRLQIRARRLAVWLRVSVVPSISSERFPSHTVSLEFFVGAILPVALWPWFRLSLLTDRSTRNIYRGKGGRFAGLTALQPSYADCLKVWKPHSLRTLRACPSLYRDCFTLPFTGTLFLITPRPLPYTFFFSHSLFTNCPLIWHCACSLSYWQNR